MENQDFDWGQFGWTVPIVVAIMAGVFALFNKIVDKRTDPIDGMEKVLNRYQVLLEAEERRSSRAREREKEAFKTALEFRAYSTSWERWFDAGMPDPPGRPTRPSTIMDDAEPSAHTDSLIIVKH